MMKKLPIPFKIVNIEEAQYATFPENLKTEGNLEENIGFGFGVDIDHNIIAINFQYTLLDKGLPVIKSEIACFFEIEPSAFHSLIHDNSVIVPKETILHLCTIVVGTARGILFANTKNTLFQKFSIGLLNLHEMIKEDISIELAN